VREFVRAELDSVLPQNALLQRHLRADTAKGSLLHTKDVGDTKYSEWLPVGADGSQLEADSSSDSGLVWSGGRSCKVFNSAATVLAVPAGGFVGPVPFPSEQWDHGGMHSTTVNNHRITLNKLGVWLVGFNLPWEVRSDYPSGTDYTTRIVKNGATVPYITNSFIASLVGSAAQKTVQPWSQGAVLVQANAVTDFLHLEVASQFTTNIVSSASGGESAFAHFWAAWLHPAIGAGDTA
jgi:hypothetical protein